MTKTTLYVVAGCTAAALAVWVAQPFVWFGWVGTPPQRPSGSRHVKTADLAVRLPAPGAVGATAPIDVRVWFPADPATGAQTQPLILYAPGWGGRGGDNTLLAKELASHGFVVAAIDDIALDPAELDRSADDAAIRMTPLAVDTDASRSRTLAVFPRRVALQAAKVTALLDAIAAQPSLWPVEAQFDPRRIGMLGFSFGGATAVEAALTDPGHRIRAVVNLDGWLYGAADTLPLDVPFAEFNSTRGVPSPADVASADPVRRFFAGIAAHERAVVGRQLAAQPAAVALAVAGAEHGDFSDALYDPRRWRQWRPWRMAMIRPQRLRHIVDSVVVGFFSQHLKGADVPPFAQILAQFPEVTISRGAAVATP